jgi:KDO2-lipid IV(A) lauroyltransferase
MSYTHKSDTDNSQPVPLSLPTSDTSNVKLLLCLARTFTRLPTAMIRFVATVLGQAAYWLYPKERHVALKNVRTFYPNASASMQRSIVVRSFRHIVRSAFDLMPLAAERSARWPALTIRHIERLDAALGEGRGVVLITGHYGNPEILALVLKGRCSCPGFLYKPTRRGWVIDQFRRYRQTVLISSSNLQPLESSARGVRKAGQLLRRGNVVVMAADLTWGSGFIPVSFLNRTFRMSRVPASISLRTRALLLPVVTVRDHDGGYDIILEEPIEHPLAKSRSDAERTMTETFARILERYVDSAPEQWGWLQLADQSEQAENSKQILTAPTKVRCAPK